VIARIALIAVIVFLCATDVRAAFRPLRLIQPEPSPSPTATVTPLPPPIVPPPDAAGISATTPPLSPVSPKPEPTIPDMIWPANSNSVTVGFAVHSGHIYVPVVLDGVKREFLLSTLDPTAIDESLVSPDAPEPFVAQTLQIGDARLTRLSLATERIAPWSQMYLGTAADGIIGSELFARYVVTIDYAAQQLTIALPQPSPTLRKVLISCGACCCPIIPSASPTSVPTPTPSPSPTATPAGELVLPLTAADRPEISCTLDGAFLECDLDVNADFDLTLPSSSAVAEQLTRTNRVVTAMEEAEPGAEMIGVIVRARTLMMGRGTTLDIDAPLVRIADMTNSLEHSMFVVPRIGNGVLDRFAVTIDEPDGRLELVPEAGTETEPSFDRSGMWLIWRNGAVTVRSVVAHSPAQAAGLTSGDTIDSVNGALATDLDATRALFAGEPGTRVTVVYQHAGHQQTTTVVLRELI